MVKVHISRDAALAELQRVYDLLSGYHPSFYAGFQFAVKTLESIQAADVALVVRCKDCKWNNKTGACVNHKCINTFYAVVVPPSHFCSYGERKINDG